MKRPKKTILIVLAALALAVLAAFALCPKPNPGKPVPAAWDPNQPEGPGHEAR